MTLVHVKLWQAHCDYSSLLTHFWRTSATSIRLRSSSFNSSISLPTVASGLDDHVDNTTSVGFSNCSTNWISYPSNPTFSASIRKSSNRRMRLIFNIRQTREYTFRGMHVTLVEREGSCTWGCAVGNAYGSSTPVKGACKIPCTSKLIIFSTTSMKLKMKMAYHSDGN